jgi:hypothetical protein
MDEKELFKKSIELWGEGTQMAMLAEEASELAVAALHMCRARKDNCYDNLAEEIADVEFMIAEMKYVFPNLWFDVLQHRKAKRARLENIIEKEIPP